MTSYPRSSTSRINSDAFRAGMTDGRQFENIVNHAANLHVSFNQVPRTVSDDVIENINNIKKIKNIFSENIDASTTFTASSPTTDRRSVKVAPEGCVPNATVLRMSALGSSSNGHRDLIPPTPPMFHSYIPANTLVSPNMATDGLPSTIEENYVSKSPVESTNSTLVDKITMEYMMNKQHYKKYLAKTNNGKYESTKKKHSKCDKIPR